MKKIVIAGGTGFLGKVLIQYFKERVAQIVVLSRKEMPPSKNVRYLVWDGKNQGEWSQALENTDVLINLAGKSVDCRYNQKNKDLILSSRIDSTRALGRAVQACTNPPKVWLNSSTATIYRHSLQTRMDETNGEIGNGFSENVAKEWERVFFSFKLNHTRQVALRTSIVLGKSGGAFIPLKWLTTLGLGGKQGTGTQKVSWIHEQDFVRSIDFVIKNEKINGVINVVSPSPTNNKTLQQTLRKRVGALFGIPLSVGLLELGAKIMRTETELILKSRNVVPKKLLDHGYDFVYPSLDDAIQELLM
ncbi:MAG: TIGR01777 family oxidoreductase [Bacteroidota bacterium]